MYPLEPFQTQKWSSDSTNPLVSKCYIASKHDDTSSSCEKVVLRGRMRREKEGFPPPLPLRGALKRYHTWDGRLVIESGRLPEILRAHRENNRLTIDLISLEDDDNDDEMDGADGERDDPTVEEDPMRSYKYDYGVRSNPCMVGIMVPAIRHVPI